MRSLMLLMEGWLTILCVISHVYITDAIGWLNSSTVLCAWPGDDVTLTWRYKAINGDEVKSVTFYRKSLVDDSVTLLPGDSASRMSFTNTPGVLHLKLQQVNQEDSGVYTVLIACDGLISKKDITLAVIPDDDVDFVVRYQSADVIAENIVHPNTPYIVTALWNNTRLQANVTVSTSPTRTTRVTTRCRLPCDVHDVYFWEGVPSQQGEPVFVTVQAAAQSCVRQQTKEYMLVSKAKAVVAAAVGLPAPAACTILCRAGMLAAGIMIGVLLLSVAIGVLVRQQYRHRQDSLRTNLMKHRDHENYKLANSLTEGRTDLCVQSKEDMNTDVWIENTNEHVKTRCSGHKCANGFTTKNMMIYNAVP